MTEVASSYNAGLIFFLAPPELIAEEIVQNDPILGVQQAVTRLADDRETLLATALNEETIPLHSLVESVTDDNHLATTAFYGLAPHNAAHWLELHCAVGHVMLNRFFSLNAAGNVCKQPSCTRLPPEERHPWACGP